MSSVAVGNNDSEGAGSGGNVKLLDRVRKLLGAGASASLSWEEFVSDFLARDRVERLVVGHDGWARVHLKGASTSKVDATPGHVGSIRGNSGPPRHGEGAMASWLGWTGFRLPSLLSWEFDDVVSEVSSGSLGSDSTDSSEGGDDRRGEGGAGRKDLTAVAVDGKEDEEANSGSRLYLQIGRPSYLERNLKLAYLRLDIPPHRFKCNAIVNSQLTILFFRFIHIVYNDRKHLGSSSSNLCGAIFSLFLTLLPILIIIKVGHLYFCMVTACVLR